MLHNLKLIFSLIHAFFAFAKEIAGKMKKFAWFAGSPAFPGLIVLIYHAVITLISLAKKIDLTNIS